MVFESVCWLLGLDLGSYELTGDYAGPYWQREHGRATDVGVAQLPRQEEPAIFLNSSTFPTHLLSDKNGSS